MKYPRASGALRQTPGPRPHAEKGSLHLHDAAAHHRQFRPVTICTPPDQILDPPLDSMCDILVRLLRRFMKGQAVEKRYGSDLTSIECQDVKLQLPDKSIVIGKGAREALVKLTSEQQR